MLVEDTKIVFPTASTAVAPASVYVAFNAKVTGSLPNTVIIGGSLFSIITFLVLVEVLFELSVALYVIIYVPGVVLSIVPENETLTEAS